MSQNPENNYLGYQAMVSTTNESMSAMSAVCTNLGLDSYAETLNATRRRMRDKIFSVGIMGEFRRGKSTVINALLGKEIVPSDIVPTSATLNYIRWDSKPGVTVHFKDGTEQAVGIDELSNFVTKVTPEAEQMAERVEDAVVTYPCRFCQNGVQIVDTPGLNDSERMTAITERVIPTLDAIVLVMVKESPFSMSEAEFVRTKLMTSDLGRLIFVMNKIDEVRKKDRQRLLDHTKEKIRETVLSRIASIYGEDSEEYKNALDKVGAIRIFGVSARDALEGRLEGDEELVKQSGFPEFEEALSYMLTEERGILDLLNPVNTTLSVGREAMKNIEMRRKAAELSKEEIERITEEGKAAVEEQRAAKKAALDGLREKAQAVYGKFLPELDTAYDRAEAALLEKVEQMDIKPEDVNSDKKMNDMGRELEKEMQKAVETSLSDQTEWLLNLVNKELDRDVEEVQKLAEEISVHLASLQEKLVPPSNDAFTWGTAAFDAVTNLFGVFGVGGILTGWKEAGWKGALVGGGLGFLGGYGSMIATMALLGGSFVAFFPAAAVGGIVAAFLGKASVKTIFKKSIGTRNTKTIKANLHTAVQQSMTAVRAQRVLEHWLKDATNVVYNGIATELDRDLENSLIAFENTLAALTLDRQQKESKLEATFGLLDRSEERLRQIEEQVRPIKEKLVKSLELTETTTEEPAIAEKSLRGVVI